MCSPLQICQHKGMRMVGYEKGKAELSECLQYSQVPVPDYELRDTVKYLAVIEKRTNKFWK